jgi:hypothetical protein
MAAERTVDAYVAALPDGQREIAEAVRRLVRSAAPEAREAFKYHHRAGAGEDVGSEEQLGLAVERPNAERLDIGLRGNGLVERCG